MIHTRICDLLDIKHPVVLGGMGGATSAKLVAAVSNSGALGTLGTSRFDAAALEKEIAAIRAATEAPFGINHLLFRIDEACFEVTLRARPALVAFAWAWPDQDLRAYFQRAHDAGCKVMFQAGEVPEAVRAAEAGADFIVSQGTEGGGHVGWMASMAAGGVADGRGLAAALALGAEGVLVGTRFLATHESPLHPNYKEAIVRSDGHDTVLTEIPDIAAGQVWPGAMSRAQRNAFIEKWSGREWALRQVCREAGKEIAAARAAGNIDRASLSFGQDAGLIDAIVAAGEVATTMVVEAERIVQSLRKSIRE